MKNHIIVYISVFFLFALTAFGNEKAKDMPNVIIVMTDDQGYGELSCHGNPILKTPNLDDLAGRSLRFDDKTGETICSAYYVYVRLN
jgi:hypothetical protein